MSLIDKLASAINNIQSARDALKIGWSLPPKRTSDQWADMFHKSPMLDPVHMIASDVAGVEFKIYDKLAYRRDKQDVAPFADHPIYDLLEHPMPDHPEMDYYQLMYLTDVYYEIIGDAFWLIDRGPGGKAAGIYIIPPTWMLLTPSMNIPYYRIQPMGNTSHRFFNADPADVVWFKAPDVTNPYGRGRARAEAVGDEVETHEFSSKYSKNFFYNDAVPPLILEMPGISQKDADAFKESWMQRLGGYLNARKPGIVAQKEFKVHQLSTSPREMDFTESRKYLIQMANEHFSVPPEMRGNLQNSNRATIDSAAYLWSKFVVSKRLKLFSAPLNNQFVPMFGNNILWRFDNIVAEDSAFMVATASDGFSKGTITRNEWRAIASSCGIPLKPDDARGDVYVVGFNSVEVPAFKKAVAPLPTVPPTPETPAPEETKAINFDQLMDELKQKTDALPCPSVGMKFAATTANKLSKDQKLAIWKAFDAKATGVEPGFKKAVYKISQAQRDIIKQGIKSIKNENDVAKVLAKVFIPKEDMALRDELAPAWVAGMEQGQEHALVLLGTAKRYQGKAIQNPLFSQWVKKYGLIKAKEINTTTYDDLRKTLATELSDSIDAGESLAKMVKRLLDATDEEYDNMDDYRAEMIARTESSTSVNYGTYATYKAEGVETKTWLATQDERTRDAHSEADGQTVKIDDPFDVGGESMDYPGDPEAAPENVINCRCTTLGGMFEGLMGGGEE